MANDNIKEFLKIYIDNPDPRYAVMLKGKWGCGKTYFIDNWLSEYQQPEDGEETDIVLEPIKVSLYGMTDVDQITKAIDRALHPLLYSKGAQIAKNILKIAGKVVLKTNFDVDGDHKDDASFTASLDSLSLLNSKEDNVKGVKFLIFDDIERSHIGMQRLLGYINYFVEYCSCHVVLIGDETKVDDEKERKTLDEFKEKTVGREFDIKPDYEVAVDFFIHEDQPEVEWLHAHIDFILSVFKASGCDNLRILRQCLYDFKVQFMELDEELVSNDHNVLKSLLGTFIAVYCEYKGKNKEIMSDWRGSYFFGLQSKKTEQYSIISGLQSKYKPTKTHGVNVLNSNYIPWIVEHISKGISLKNYIEKALLTAQVPLGSLGNLERFYELENDVFHSYCQELDDQLLQGENRNLFFIGKSVAYLSYFDSIGLRGMGAAVITLVKVHLRQLISEANDITVLYKMRGDFLQGLASLDSFNKGQETCSQDIVQFFEDEMKNKSMNLPDEMTAVLLSLNNDNCGQLVDIDKKTVPDGHCAYESMPILFDMNMNDLMNRIRGLNNKSLREFSLFLTRHYQLSYYLGDDSPHKKDKEALKELQKLIEKESNKRRSVDRFNYENLLDVVSAAVKRCEGYRDALV